jgi:uncharacterized protein DUF6644
MQALAQWLAGTPASQGIQRELWLIPLLQSVHILAIAMVLSSVAMIDLRILGVGRSQTMVQTARRFVPWLWTGLVLLAATGLALIVGEPKRSLPNFAFQLKMILVALAIASTFLFQLSLRRNTTFWDDKRPGRTITIILAVTSFALWCAIAVAGRWIAYMTTP